MPLTTVGAVFALLFIIYLATRALRGRTGITWKALLLAVFTIAPVSVFVTLNTQPESLAIPAAITGSLLLAGGVVFLLERRKGNPGWNQSQGLMAAGVSVLLLVSMFAAPLLPTLMANTVPGAAVSAQDDLIDDEVQPPTPQPSPTAQPTSTPTQPPTNTPRPTVQQQTRLDSDLLEALPTQYVFTTPAATTTPAQVELCRGVIQNNLNFRAAPALDADLLLTIPHSTDVGIYGQNSDGTWLSIQHSDQFGWVSAEYVVHTCGDLPVQG